MKDKENIKLIECPRDAMQGIKDFVPTEEKADYINQLLKVGYDTIDFGSFVSPKAIPQMKDTSDLLKRLDLTNTNSKLLAIVANTRGGRDAVQFEEIDYLGFPFSISEEFQQRNTGSSIEESLTRVEEIQELCVKNNKEMVVYISMAFGNPYQELWHPDIAVKWSEILSRKIGIKIIALSDTIGVSNPSNISEMYTAVSSEMAEVEFGVHLHTTKDKALEKIEAAFNAGCRRFDGALKGYGGCPMAKDELTGNMPTETIVAYLNNESNNSLFAGNEFDKSMEEASKLFGKYH